MIKLIENFIPNSFIKELQDTFISNDQFDWYMRGFTNPQEFSKDTESTSDSFYFVHSLYHWDKQHHSPHFITSKRVLQFLEQKEKFEIADLFRIKANLYTNNSHFVEGKHHRIHTDSDDEKYYSFLYFVNDSDGDIMFFDRDNKIIQQFTPKAGSGVLFKSKIPHTGSNPIKSNLRTNINFIFSLRSVNE